MPVLGSLVFLPFDSFIDLDALIYFSENYIKGF